MESHESEKAEASTYRNNECSVHYDGSKKHAKKKICPAEEDDIDNRMQKKGSELTSSSFSKGQDYRLRKRKWRKEKQWKIRGHLPDTSTKQKFIVNAQMWKSSFTITNLQMKLGGYTAKKSRFLNMHEVQSLEEAISLGFLLVRSNKS